MELTSNQIERFWGKVRKTDTCWTWSAATNSHGYGVMRIGRKLIGAHRISYELSSAEIPAGMFIDHKCFNRSCVNPRHLRVVTNKQNLENMSGPIRTNTSGVRGVSWRVSVGKWQAHVRHNDKRFYLGVFATLSEAESAVIAKRNELFTHNELDRAA